jgi:hypothetical protein
MRSRLQREIETHPLRLLVIVGLGLRLVAAIFARGYMATDDHNQVIEMAAQWLRGGSDYLAGDRQFYRSLLYPYVNYLQIAGCHAIGITHPDRVMFVNRLLHAVFSLWTVVLAYRLGNRLGDARVAFTSGLIVAASAVMPYVAVRNLIEAVAIPFLLLGVYEAVCAMQDRGAQTRRWFFAGIAFGIAFLIRWQVASAVAGVGVYLLVKREWRGLSLLSLAFMLPVACEGLWDWQAHGVFLGSFWRYIEYNTRHAYDYVVGPWYRYLVLILGIFIPPFSLFLVYASGRYIRRLGILAWAVLPFLIVHSIVPGKQERFLLPIFPELALLFVLAVWHWQREHSEVSARRIRYGWRWFWTVNVILLFGALTHYGQRGKIEPLIGLYEQGNALAVLFDMTERGRQTDLPLYYLDGGGIGATPVIFQAVNVGEIDSLSVSPDARTWKYVVVFSRGGFEEHRAMLEARLGPLEIVRHIGPTLIEKALLFFNPKYTHSRESWLCVVGRSQ